MKFCMCDAWCSILILLFFFVLFYRIYLTNNKLFFLYEIAAVTVHVERLVNTEYWVKCSDKN